MILRYVCWSIFLCLALQPTVKAQVHVTDQGYQNVLISFAPNVPSENGQELIKNVTDLLKDTSSALHTAIGIQISTVTFLLPPSWSTEKWEGFTINPATFDEADRQPDISVDATEESPFGKQPVALQHGGCGVPGHHITLPLEFLRSEPNYPKDKLLAREWLKHRYGVFEENGFKKDDLYTDFYRIPGTADLRIAECTNQELKYKFMSTIYGDECNPLESENCIPHPEGELLANVTSSLMFFHQDLQNMEHICGKDHPHNNMTVNKQNVLCNGQSIWDVVSSSKDFEITQSPTPEPIQFSYIQPSQPRFVVLLEDSEKLHAKGSSIKLALRRFYYDLPPKSKLAIYTFASDPKKVKETLAYKELPIEGRDDLGSITDFISPPDKICTSCGLVKAIETLLQNSEVRKGSIFLITASSLDTTLEITEDVKAAGISLNVLRFAGAEDPVPVDDTYEALKESFTSFSYVEIPNSSEELENFKTLYSFLENPVPEINDFKTVTLDSAIMSAEKTVTIPQDATASLYTLWVGTQYKDADSITCKTRRAEVLLTDGMKATDISSFTFTPVVGEVTCSLSSSVLPPVLTQVQMTTNKGYYFDFDTWIHDGSTEKEQTPIIIYAKIYFGGYPVKEANVSATVTVEKKADEETGGASYNEEAIVLKLLDNGRGDPDITQHDGVYSGYFAGFETAGNYQIAVKINDHEGKVRIGKEDPELVSATCCGSKVPSKDGAVPAFEMEKLIEYTARNKMPEGGYPPSRIVDLQAKNASNMFLLFWTAPGPVKASSYEFYAFCDFEDCEDGRLPNWLQLNETELKPKSYGEPEEVEILFTPNISKVERNLSLSFAIKSVSETGKLSDLSNKAEIFLSLQAEPNTTTGPITDDGRNLSSSDTIGIIVGSIIIGVFLLLCIGALLYVYVFMPRRAKPSDIDSSGYQDKNQNGTEVSGSFRAVPVRVRGSLKRVQSFPVLLYTHDQLKDFKKKVDPPLYKPDIAARPWMSMNVLSHSELNKGGDSKSIGSASTLPMNDKHRSTEMKQLDDVSLASDTPHPQESIKV